MYENKDGSADRRRSGNPLIYCESKLYIRCYEVTCLSPYNMILLVNKIRDTHSIALCYEEYEKYRTLCADRDKTRCVGNIWELYQTYRKDPFEFETLVARLYHAMGYETTQTARTNDGGYDILLSQGNEYTIVECKCYDPKSKISRPLLQKLAGANQVVHADHMIFVTTCNYSKEAEEYAGITGIELISGNQIVRLLHNYLYSQNQHAEVEKKECRLTREDLQKYYPPDVLV